VSSLAKEQSTPLVPKKQNQFNALAKQTPLKKNIPWSEIETKVIESWI
jgi:hypothetical protein